MTGDNLYGEEYAALSILITLTFPQRFLPMSLNTEIPNAIVDELASKLSHTSLPAYPEAFHLLNPVDVFRSCIARKLAEISAIDPNVIFSCLDWTNILDKGDLILAVPRL